MTISEQTGRYIWTGNDVTEWFTYPYSFTEASHLKLYLYEISTDTETELTPGTYTVQANGGPDPYTSATIHYPLTGSPMTTDEQLIVYRDNPLEQSTDLTNQSSYFLENIEKQLDRHAMMLQDLQDQLTRTPQTHLANLPSNQIRLGPPSPGEFLVWGLPPDDDKIFSSSLIDLSLPNLNADTVDGEHAVAGEEPGSGLLKYGDYGLTRYALQRTGTRANDFVNSGYYYSTGLADAPGANAYVFHVMNSGMGGTIYGIAQMAFDLMTPSNVYCRALDSGGTWQPWGQIALVGNHNHVEADITDLDKYTQAEVNALLAAQTHVEADITDLDKYTQAEVNAALALKANLSLMGAANGIATLDGSGLVPSAQLPSYVDDVIEVADYASLPGTGETGKIYVTLDTGNIYRWSGSAYIEINTNVGQADYALNSGLLDNLDSSQFARSDTNDNLSGVYTFSSNSAFPVTISGTNNGKISLQGSSSPYIDFRDGVTSRGTLIWQSSSSALELINSLDSSRLRVKDDLDFSLDGVTYYSVYHTGNDSVLVHTTGSEIIAGAKRFTSDLRIDSTTNSTLIIDAGANTDVSQIFFNIDTATEGRIVYDHDATDANETLDFNVGGSSNLALRIFGDKSLTAYGVTTVQGTDPDFRVRSTSATGISSMGIYSQQGGDTYSMLELYYDDNSNEGAIKFNANGLKFIENASGTETTQLTIDGAGNLDVTGSATALSLTVDSTANANLSLNADSDSDLSQILFQRSGGTTRGRLVYNHNATAANETLDFNVGGAVVGTLTASSELTLTDISNSSIISSLTLENNGTGTGTGTSITFSNAGQQGKISSYYNGTWNLGFALGSSDILVMSAANLVFSGDFEIPNGYGFRSRDSSNNVRDILQISISDNVYAGTAAHPLNLIAAEAIRRSQGAPTAETTSATLTAAEIATGIITVNNGAAGTTTLTLPTAASMDSYFTGLGADSGVEFSVINTSTVAAEDASIATNTGWSLVGSMDIESNDSANARSAARFIARRTGAAAYILYRLA